MKYCSNCGQPLREGIKVCTNCGEPVRGAKQHSSQTHQDESQKAHSTQHSSQQRHQKGPQQHNNNKKTWIIIAIIAVVLVALIVLFSVLKSQFSPEKQASTIAQSIKKDDAKSLSNKLTTEDGNQLSEEESRAYLDYIKSEDNLDNVGNKVEQKAKDLKRYHYNDVPVDANGNNVLNIKKDGKKYLFFDNYQFNVPQHSVSIYPSDSGKITYELNGEKHNTEVEQDRSKTLGTFPIGNYNLKATKEMDGKKFKGALMIDMGKDASTAYESFKQKRFTVNIDGGSMLDNVKVYANDKEIGDESSYDTYGPYDPDEKVTVYAQGTYEGKSFRSNSVNVTNPTDEDNDVTTVDLSFDEDEIDNYIDEKDKASEEEDDDSDSSSEEVTRDNVIDKVESYEGHKLDIDTYTYKEPEITDDGKWGFSFTDKDGELAGSYTVDRDDGYVTEYDEHGDKVGSGY